MKPDASAMKDHIAFLLCTWFGLGKLPKAPGTWGSLGALPFAWLLQSWGGWPALAVALLLLCAVSFWAIAAYLRRWPGDDPGEIVIDEVAGQWLVLLFAPTDWLFYLVAFVMFRVLDISKPWPASWADKRLHGPTGIMLDDLLAALYGCLVMIGVQRVLA